ncbi:MAG: hypothetical protein K8U57_33295 [Planctomycetes bacterium]|nr:hypothetical protein [Planctomycetota bacterium]
MLTLAGHKGDVRTVAFAPDGSLISGGSDRTVRVWNPVTGECRTTVKAGQIVYAVAVSPDGKTFAWGGRPASGAVTSAVQLADATGKKTRKLEFATTGIVSRFDTVSMTLHTEEQPMARSVWGLAFSTDGKYLAAAVRRPGSANIPYGAGGCFWTVNEKSEAHALPGNDIYALAFATVGHALAVTSEQSVLFLDRPEATEAVTYPLTANWSAGVAFIPGSALAVVASNSFLEFVNPTKREKVTRLKTGCRTIIALAASPDGKTVLAGGRPGAVEVYDTKSLKKLTEYDFKIGGVHALAFAPDGLTFAAAGDDGLVVCDAAI